MAVDGFSFENPMGHPEGGLICLQQIKLCLRQSIPRPINTMAGMMKMTKLWNKGYDVNKAIEKFTVGNDFLLDQSLVPYDCASSLAHAKMLKKIGVLSADELMHVKDGLNEVVRQHKIGKFTIEQSDEDCHTAIENFLVSKFGDVGKKIHTGRSRNDQVLVALRLYEKDSLKKIVKEVDSLISILKEKIAKDGKIKMPGYTHMQKAMPSSVGMLFGAYVSSLVDDKKSLLHAISIIDQNPLGSAAGFGVALPLDRKMTTKELGFSSVQENPLYCQNSRGKFEALVIDSLVQVMMSLNKIATDLMLYTMQEFEYFSLPKEFCTGSSIMPQKKNPDVLELLRAKYAMVLGYEAQVKNLYSGLISGYNRDMQLSKESVMKALSTTLECVSITGLLFSGITVNKEKCLSAMTPELFAVDEALKLVQKGMPWREAYKMVGEKYK